MIDLLKAHPFFSDKKIDSCTLLECQGYCNENYLVVAEDKKYIARKLVRTDIDRSFEYKVQNLAFEKRLTAEPCVFDEENSFMVSAFLEGIHKSILDENDLNLLADTLRKLHNIKVDSTAIKLSIETQSDEVQKAFEILDNHTNEPVLCHNDLNPKNILFSDTISFIDWEYAGVNDKYFDLACVCVEFGLEGEKEKYFLVQYAETSNYNQKKLEAYKTIYIALCKQWFDESEFITLPSQT